MDDLTLQHCRVPPDYYDQGIKNDPVRRIWHKKRFAEVCKTLNGIKPYQILDIGCHGGTFAEVIGKKFPKAAVFGIDISRIAIEYGKKMRPKINFKLASAENLPFPNDSFDLITCFDTLEHLVHPNKALSEMRRVLVKDGEVVFLLPTESLLFRIGWFFLSRFGPQKVWQKTHVQNFNGKRLDDLLEKSGFKIETRKTINLGMLLLIKARLASTGKAGFGG